MIFRVNKRSSPYVIIDKRSQEDTKLSWKAKGLHAYLMGRPDKWKVHMTHLETISTDGREATQSAMKELLNEGYVVKHLSQGAAGRIEGWDYDIYEVPTVRRLSRLTVKPSDGKPATSKEGEEVIKDGSKFTAAPYIDIWEANQGRFQKRWFRLFKELESKHGRDALLRGWTKYAMESDAKFNPNADKFAATVLKWMGGGSTEQVIPAEEMEMR